MTKSTTTIKQITAKETWPIRHTVMWPEQPLDFVKLKNDKEGSHFGLFLDEELVSVVSLFRNRDEGQFRKLATLPEHQGKGYGTRLLTKIIQIAQQEKLTRIWCNARSNKTDFYTQFGMKVTHSTFTKAGMDYIIMEKIFS
jgi:predicted GNAT family N-acyltransferase